jgi:hypothetical protein
VRWASGRVETRKKVSVGRVLDWEEGDGKPD